MKDNRKRLQKQEMAISINVTTEDGYIRIKPSGVLETIEDLIEYGSYIYNQARLSGIPRVLLDEKDMEDAAEANTIYDWCEHEVVHKTATAGIRIAGISEPENYEINVMFETMLQNRSYNFKTFLNETEAIKWLLA